MGANILLNFSIVQMNQKKFIPHQSAVQADAILFFRLIAQTSMHEWPYRFLIKVSPGHPSP